METKDTCFCEESLIDRSFLILEILGTKGTKCPPWLHKPKRPMVNKVKVKSFCDFKFAFTTLT